MRSVEWYYTLVEHFNSTGGTVMWQGSSKAARQQYQREYEKRKWWLIPPPAVTGDGASSRYIKELRGWRDFKSFWSRTPCFCFLTTALGRQLEIKFLCFNPVLMVLSLTLLSEYILCLVFSRFIEQSFLAQNIKKTRCEVEYVSPQHSTYPTN